MDADGDLDLMIGSRPDGCYRIENAGTAEEPAWSSGAGRVINLQPVRLQRFCSAGSTSSNSKVNPSSSNRRGTQ